MSRRRPEARREPVPVESLVRYGTLPLRLFLGLTFIYAGLQKLADPGYLRPGAPTYIGSQMQAFASGSPVGFLFDIFALPYPQAVGVLIILAELAIGLGAVLGVMTRIAAGAGALLNLLLFLSASWKVSPYFLGSDSIYAVAWVTLALVGDQGVWSLGRWLRPSQPVGGALDPERRVLLLRGGAAFVGLVWLLALVPKSRATGLSPSPASSPSPSPSPSASAGGASPPPNTGPPIGSLSSLQSQGALQYTDPASGDPAWAVDLGGSNLVAYDAICTHAGCTVEWDRADRLLVCPCHGAAYDPAHGAQVVAGPAPQPLASLKVTVRGGEVYSAD